MAALTTYKHHTLFICEWRGKITELIAFLSLTKTQCFVFGIGAYTKIYVYHSLQFLIE